MKAIWIIPGLMLCMACGNTSEKEQLAAQQRRVDSLAAVVAAREEALARERALDSMNQIVAEKEREVLAAQAAAAAKRSNSGATRTVVYENTSAHAGHQQRKGWSSTATGAAIGAGVGAISGALIDDRKGRGALIGGVAGAGVGAGTGAIIDNQKKKKEAQR